MIKTTWAQLRQVLVTKGLSAQWAQDDNSYTVSAIDGSLLYTCIIPFATPASTDQADFEANFKSPGNKVIAPEYSGSYNLPISISPSILTSGTYFWSMRNNTTGNRMFLQKIVLTMTYGGLTTSATPSKFAFQRFSGGNPSGGNALTAIKSDTNFPTSNLLDARESDSGLTITGLTIESPLMPFSVVSQLATSTTVNLLFPLEHEFTLICLNPGEGIIFSATNTLVSGVTINGFVEWVERV